MAKTTSRSKRTYQKHGLTRLKSVVKRLGNRVIDRRTSIGKALHAWRAELVADLGGRDSISTQQAALVDLAVKTKLMLDSVDAWLLTQPSLINSRKRSLIPVVKERLSLSSHLLSVLKELGLERKATPVPTLSEYLAMRPPSPREPLAAAPATVGATKNGIAASEAPERATAAKAARPR